MKEVDQKTGKEIISDSERNFRRASKREKAKESKEEQRKQKKKILTKIISLFGLRHSNGIVA